MTIILNFLCAYFSFEFVVAAIQVVAAWLFILLLCLLMLLFVACWQARGIVQRSFTLLVMSGTFLLLLFCFCICFCFIFNFCCLLFVGRRAASFNVVTHCLPWVVCFSYYCFAFVFVFVLLLIFVVCCLLAGARHCSTPLHITCHAWYVYVIIILLLYLLLFIFNFCCLLFVGRRAASFNLPYKGIG